MGVNPNSSLPKTASPDIGGITARGAAIGPAAEADAAAAFTAGLAPGSDAARFAETGAPEKLGTGRALPSTWRSVSRVKSWTNCEWRKRTSIFAGWTLTSTSCARQRDEQQRDRKNAARQDVAVGLVDRVQQQAVTHEAPIDEDVDTVAIAALHFGP